MMGQPPSGRANVPHWGIPGELLREAQVQGLDLKAAWLCVPLDSDVCMYLQQRGAG